MIDCHYKMKSTNGEPEMYQGYTEGIYGVWLNMNAWR